MASRLRLSLLLAWAVVALLAADAPPPPPPATPAEADDAPEEAAPEVATEETAEAEDEADEADEAEETAEEAPSPPPADDTASVQYMVTNKMRAELEGLGYTAPEIDAMNAERAAAIIARKIARPRTGVPPGWKRGAGKAAPLMSRIRSSKVLIPGISTAAASILAAIVTLAVKLSGGGGSSPAPVAFEPEEETRSDGFVPSDADMWLDRLIDDTILRIKLKLRK